MPLLYLFFRTLFRSSLKGYFRRITLTGAVNIPEGEAIIFAANHNSAVMDPIVLGALLPVPVHFLARGETFNSAFRRWLFRHLNMIPVFRPEINPGKMLQNRDMLREGISLLGKAKALLIFPEAVSSTDHYLRPMRSGLARIAFAALEHAPGKEVWIIPVGINYSDAHRLQSNLLISIGKPIRTSSYMSQNRGNHAKNISDVMDGVTSGLRNCMTGYRHPLTGEMLRMAGLNDQDEESFTQGKELAEKAEKCIHSPACYSQLKSFVQEYRREYREMQKYRSRRGMAVVLISNCIFPLFILGLIPAAIGYLLGIGMTKREDWKGSMIFVLSTFVYVGFMLATLIILPFFGVNFFTAILAAALFPLFTAEFILVYHLFMPEKISRNENIFRQKLEAFLLTEACQPSAPYVHH